MSAGKLKRHKQSNTPKMLNREVKPIESIPVDSNTQCAIYLLPSFFLPFAILGTAFALNRIYPFGGSTILMHDFTHQYYPFLSSLWHKLREGTVSTWSWTAGMGHDYISLIAYYMASPLNLLAMLAPHEWLREMLTLILLIKIGCAGLFTAIFLRYTFTNGSLSARQTSMALAVFSSLYALCAFTLGYFWNIIWFDGFALLPLVMMGLLALMRDGKYLLYIGALALAVFANFYIGFFVCVSVAMVFFAYSFIRRLSLRTFLSKLGMVAACSALAVGMASVLLLPTYSALQSTYAMGNTFPAKIGFYTSFFDILGNFIAFTPPTFFSGLPNIYSGIISVLFIGIFAVSPKIALREKLVFIGAVVFLVFCCNHGTLDYVMHGFRNTNDITFRFSFLISFMLVVMAYRVYILTDSMTSREGKLGLTAMGVCAAMLLLSAIIGTQGKNAAIGSAALCVFYLLLFFGFSNIKKIKSRTVIRTMFLLAIITELFITAYIGIKTVTYFPERSKFPYNYIHMQELLALRTQSDLPDSRLPDGQDKAGSDFYRTEMFPESTPNDAYLYNYNGISFFSTTMNGNVLRFTRGLGIPCQGTSNNFFLYQETTPLLNTFLNMRYIVFHARFPADRGQYWEIIEKKDVSLLAENKYYLPLGFMVNNEVAAYKSRPSNPFQSQNNLFNRATGLDGSLFAITDLSGSTPTAKDGNSGALTWDYEMPHDGLLYAYFDNGKKSSKIDISVNGSSFWEIYILNHVPYIATIGSFSKGDIISFTPENDPIMYMGCFNSRLFDQGYALLADEVLNLTHFSETKVSGTVTALKDGILYTSIPGKNWNVYVDGEKSELLLIDNAMAAVRLSKGMHEVEFRYLNKSFVAGVVISLVSLAIFITLAVLEARKRERKGKNESTEEARKA